MTTHEAAKLAIVGAAKVSTAGSPSRASEEPDASAGSGGRPCDVSRLLGLSRTTERQYRAVLDAAGLLLGEVDDLPLLESLEAALPPTKAPSRAVRS